MRCSFCTVYTIKEFKYQLKHISKLFWSSFMYFGPHFQCTYNSIMYTTILGNIILLLLQSKHLLI